MVIVTFNFSITCLFLTSATFLHCDIHDLLLVTLRRYIHIKKGIKKGSVGSRVLNSYFNFSVFGPLDLD